MQGCQTFYFHTKNRDLGILWRVLEWEMLVYFIDNFEYFTAIWKVLWQFGKVCGHLVYFSRFGMFGPR
jgi:hypothetical protein